MGKSDGWTYCGNRWRKRKGAYPISALKVWWIDTRRHSGQKNPDVLKIYKKLPVCPLSFPSLTVIEVRNRSLTLYYTYAIPSIDLTCLKTWGCSLISNKCKFVTSNPNNLRCLKINKNISKLQTKLYLNIAQNQFFIPLSTLWNMIFKALFFL